jgi:nicotinic acid mononucleotide adenylyltransferase
MSNGPDAPTGELIAELQRHGWLVASASADSLAASTWELDSALRLALALAEECPDADLSAWREPIFTEVKRRLYPDTFPQPTAEVARVARYFFPLAGAVLREQAARDGDGIASHLPFVPLGEDEIARSPSGEEYRRLLQHVEDEGMVLCYALAQQWFGLTIEDHVLGVTGLSLWIGRQLARAVPVDLPLLHGAAIGHDIGKFGCIGDEVRRIPRLHYYYTHIYYQDRKLPSLGHIATNHSCWDLEQVRLPVETLLLIYADFRVKDWTASNGVSRMRIISLHDAFTAIRDKLENLDKEKIRRYRGVYRKLRDVEEYLQVLGVDLDPPGFPTRIPAKPSVPAGLDVVRVLAARQRPDAIALATGRNIGTLRRLMVTAHNIGVMERLRDLPALRALIEEARSFDRWRDLRTYLAIVGEYSPALSREQKALALDFFLELLGHRDDDIRYQAANRIGDLLGGGEDFWRKDLPSGVVLRPERTVLDELERVLDLLDRAGEVTAEDMGPTERILYSIPLVIRRLLRRSDAGLRAQAWELIRASFTRRLGDRRPLVGLYVCESMEVAMPFLDVAAREVALQFAEEWMLHDDVNTRLMAWRVLLALATGGRGLRPPAGVTRCLEGLASRMTTRSLPAELFLVEEIAKACGDGKVAQRCRELRVAGRDPIREVLLRNLKSRTGWVEKKVNCDYLTVTAHLRLQENRDPGAYFANEVAVHFANLLKVSRVEGTRFHAGRCLLRLLPLLTVPQRNDVTVELLRSLELDEEAVTRYIPRFLGSALASLPEQEFLEVLDDVENNARRGFESLQRLLLQTCCWLILSLDVKRVTTSVLRRLASVLLGALGESRASTANEGFAQLATVLERLGRKPVDDGRLRSLLTLVTKKLLTLVTHRPGDRVRFFLAASALNHLDRAFARMHPGIAFPEHPAVAFIPGTFDPFTAAHGAIVTRALEGADEALVQMDDYSWRKHALPRDIREELAWMALAAVPEAFLAPFKPPINLASPTGIRQLRSTFSHRRLTLVVGSDVVAGASAYNDVHSAIWSIPHAVVVRDASPSVAWEEKVDLFRDSVSVIKAPPSVATISSSSLRAALDRHEELEQYCHPLVARTLVERRLYVNYPDQKRVVPPPAAHFSVRPGARVPAKLTGVVRVDLSDRPLAGSGAASQTGIVSSNGPAGGDVAAATWREVAAAALPVLVEDASGAEPPGGRLVGTGALVETIAIGDGVPVTDALRALLSHSLARWLDAGLLFAMVPTTGDRADPLSDVLSNMGAAWQSRAATGERPVLEWATLRLTEPVVLVRDLEVVLQPPYAAAERVRAVLEQGRRATAAFFAEIEPGNALLHLSEQQLRRRTVQRACERLAGEQGPRRWVVLGLGRQFSRDIVGNTPTVAIDLERYLTWQGYEAGHQPMWGSPSLELQLAVARELGRKALLLAPFLDSPDPVIQVCEAAAAVGVAIREVIIGVTDAAVRATLELRGIRHRCEVVVPGWRGVLRESAVAPYLGGWSIAGRAPLGQGSLVPSLNDCLPYHQPHYLGITESAALDFSRLVLEQARKLLQALENEFREREGRLLSVRDLGAVVRTPRCPPLPEGFMPPHERFPSELLADDIEALARLHPETHAAHRLGWRVR